MSTVRPRRLYSIAPLAALALTAWATLVSPAHAATEHFQDLQVEVIGSGRPVLMIPGLNSGAQVWRETCAALQPQVQCHLIQLPGFAGAPAVASDDFLSAMRDRLLAYSADRKLDHPAVIGHSLGGVLALQMAIAAPQKIGPLVIVDALPYFGAVQNPAATPATLTQMAEQMRAGMLAADATQYAAQTDAAVANMAHAPEQVATLKLWGRDSDRATTANAMYSMTMTDLRQPIAGITAPVLVLGAWAAYQPFGATEASTRQVFATQYAALPGVRIEMSRAGYHFLMWDDPRWLQTQIRGFLDLPAAP
ncbi:alpha/beta hydrolase [Stenotrophomonas sp.]|uniref:alpha/beta fold hydrolase n=1 Tax=Stenotrophomonas sp. TaxID=69392 RepID=UPI0028AD5763|nr:alpha/beta hydrolase [Stenotrophomonas sp.]